VFLVLHVRMHQVHLASMLLLLLLLIACFCL
jgi:hypothetical protein